MKKMNQKGFVLAETIVVAVFIMTLFTILYNNFYPLMGEYEKREYYDDIDTKYAAYWFKNIVQDVDYDLNIAEINSSKAYTEFRCDNINYYATSKRATCERMYNGGESKISVNKAVITKYETTEFKNAMLGTTEFRDGFKDYMISSPDYTSGSINGAKYRLIIELHNQANENDDNDDNDNDFYTYSSIEVKK